MVMKFTQSVTKNFFSTRRNNKYKKVFDRINRIDGMVKL
jgi:hypothetical protein